MCDLGNVNLRAVDETLPLRRSQKDLLGTELLYNDHGATTTGTPPCAGDRGAFFHLSWCAWL
jgi:hypothetical protein